MDNSSRVGNISASTSIASSNSGHSSRGISYIGTINTSTIGTSSINTSAIGTRDWKASIAICGIVRVGFGLSHGTSGQTYDSQELVHVDFVEKYDLPTHWSSEL